MTRCQKLAYQRGYQAGIRRKWPAHLPPIPDDEVVGELMKAMQKMRNVVDGFIAMGDPDDEFAKQLDPLITYCDEACEKVTRWLEGRMLETGG